MLYLYTFNSLLLHNVLDENVTYHAFSFADLLEVAPLLSKKNP